MISFIFSNFWVNCNTPLILSCTLFAIYLVKKNKVMVNIYFVSSVLTTVCELVFKLLLNKRWPAVNVHSDPLNRYTRWLHQAGQSGRGHSTNASFPAVLSNGGTNGSSCRRLLLLMVKKILLCAKRQNSSPSAEETRTQNNDGHRVTKVE